MLQAASKSTSGHRRRRTARATLLTFAASAVAATAYPLAAAHATITTEPEQTWEAGSVVKIDDGDTVTVDVRTAAQPAIIAPAVGKSMCADRVDANGLMPTDSLGPVLRGCRVRIIGIQTAEKPGTEGSKLGQCSALAARDSLASVLPIGTRVQLRSIRVTSAERQYQGGRIARSVYYEKVPGSGVWVDAARTVLQAGLAMWMPLSVNDSEKPEYTHNLEYRKLVDEAAAAGSGIFSGRLCAPTGAITKSLRLYVVSDPAGGDSGREHVIIRNDSPYPIDISGWTLRDSSFTYARFGPGTSIPANDFIRVGGGPGVNGVPTARDYYFDGSGSMFANYNDDSGYFVGDGVYLYAPDYSATPMEYGDLRAWYHYPCEGATCTDPLVGQLVFTTVVYDPPGADTPAGEYVEIANVSQSTLALGEYRFRRQHTVLQFNPEATLDAAATLRINIGVGVDSATAVHMGRSDSLLANTGDLLMLENVDSAPVDCRAWGSMSCPPGVPMSGTVPTPTPTSTPTPTPTPTLTPTATPSYTAAPAPTFTTVVQTAPKIMGLVRPGAPQVMSVTAKSRRLTVKWQTPTSPGASAITKYRARAYLKSGTKLTWRATCYASAKKLTCRTKALSKSKTYSVRVWARNKYGYGNPSGALEIRNK